MRCRSSIFPTLSLRLLSLPVLVSSASLCAADSVVVNGKRYDNIYLGVGTEVYYIQNPADGSMITVPKDQVREKDISISPDREQRRKLRDQWRQKRLNREIAKSAVAGAAGANAETELEAAEAPPPTASPKAKAPVAAKTLPPPPTAKASAATKSPVVAKAVKQPVIINEVGQSEKRELGAVIGNIAPRGGLQGRKVFMDASGTPVLTNTPEQFSNRPEYVEVTLHYEQIEVPERFRMASATPAATSAGKPVDKNDSIEEIVSYYSRRYALDESLVYAVIRAESNGDRYAVSSAGARGLMQLMPGTAREMGVKDIFDPAENIAGGTQYLAKLLNLFENNTTLALAGYNAGPGNVKKYDGVPPFKETQEYVQRVKQYQRELSRKGAPRVRLAASKPVDADYLPPESQKYYMIVLDNGLTVAAERVYPEADRYVYVFKDRSGHFDQSAVVRIIEPS